MVTSICDMHAQLLAASQAHRGEELRTGGDWIQWKSWPVATEVLQRKSVMSAVRVGAWKSDRNGIMPAWKLLKTKKLHCSGSWHGCPSWAGLKSLHLLTGWERRKLRGAGAECGGAYEGWCGRMPCTPALHDSPLYVLAQLCPASGVEFLTNTEAQEFKIFLWNVAMHCGESWKSSRLNLSVFSFRKCWVKKRW